MGLAQGAKEIGVAGNLCCNGTLRFAQGDMGYAQGDMGLAQGAKEIGVAGNLWRNETLRFAQGDMGYAQGDMGLAQGANLFRASRCSPEVC